MSKESKPLRLRLAWIDPHTGECYERINSLPITIGRAASLNTIVLKNRYVSRQHAWLGNIDGEIIITDQDSTNGTLVDGRPIKRATLKAGGSFRIGPFIFKTDNQRSTR